MGHVARIGARANGAVLNDFSYFLGNLTDPLLFFHRGTKAECLKYTTVIRYKISKTATFIYSVLSYILYVIYILLYVSYII